MGRSHDEPLVDDGAPAEDRVGVPWLDKGHLPGVLVLVGISAADDVLEAATGGSLKPTLTICDRIDRQIRNENGYAEESMVSPDGPDGPAVVVGAAVGASVGAAVVGWVGAAVVGSVGPVGPAVVGSVGAVVARLGPPSSASPMTLHLNPVAFPLPSE